MKLSNKLKIRMYILITILLIGCVAVNVHADFNPRENINLKYVYNITNVNTLEAETANTFIYVLEGNFTDLQTKILDASPGDKIIVPKGDYNASSMIESGGKNWSILINTSNITIECHDGARIIKDSTLTSSALIGSPSSAHDDIKIENCYFDANYVNATYTDFTAGAYTGAGLVQYGDRWKVIDNTIVNAGEYGAIVWHGGHGIISHNILKDSIYRIDTRKKYATCLMVTYETAVKNEIDTNLCINPDGNGLFFEDNADYNVVTNWLSDGAYRGFSSEHTKGQVVTGLTILDSTEIPLHFLSSNNIQISDFLIWGTSGTNDAIGIYNSLTPADGHDIILRDGTLKDILGDGLYCVDTKNISFYDLHFDNISLNDLKLDNCSDYIDSNNDYTSSSIVDSTREFIKRDTRTLGLGVTGNANISGSLNVTGNAYAASFIANSENNASNPEFTFGDADTGFYETSDDNLGISINGVFRWKINNGQLGAADSGRAVLLQESPTSTNPTIVPANDDTDTGISVQAADNLSLVAGGVEGIRISEDTAILVEVFGGFSVDDNISASYLHSDIDSERVKEPASLCTAGLAMRGHVENFSVSSCADYWLNSDGDNGTGNYTLGNLSVSDIFTDGTCIITDGSITNAGDINGTGELNIGTVNTGQGDTEVYLMDQNQRTTDSPTYAGLTVSGNQSIADRLMIGGPTAAAKVHINQTEDDEALYIDMDGNEQAINIDAETTSAEAFILNVDALTNGKGLRIDADSLTTGQIVYIQSESSDASARKLIHIANEHVDADGTVLLYLKQDGANSSMLIDENGNYYSIEIDSESIDYAAISIQDMPSNKSIEIAENDSICYDGHTCAANQSYDGIYNIFSKPINASGSSIFDAGTLYVDSSGNKVGVNTTTPSHALNVVGSSNVTGDTITNRVIVPLENDATDPEYTFGDADTGFYQSTDGQIDISINGVARWKINNGQMTTSNTGRPAMLQEAPTSTNPTIVPANNDTDTGIGSTSGDILSLVAGGVEGIRITENGNIEITLDGNTTNNGDMNITGETFITGNVTFDNGGKIGSYNSTCVAIWSPDGSTVTTVCDT